MLEQLRRAPPASLGFFVLLSLRHTYVHVLHDPELVSLVRGSCITGVIVAEAVAAAADELVQQQPRMFRVSSDGELHFTPRHGRSPSPRLAALENGRVRAAPQ